MSDFSQYGGIAPEWDLLIASLPQVTLPADISPLELRRLTNEEREESSRKLTQAADDVLVQDFTLGISEGDSVPLRVYKRKSSGKGTKLPVYVWYHGGGFLFGSLGAEDGHCFKIVQDLDIIVVHVCYRHTPEHIWPTQAEDASAGLEWVFENIDTLGGDKSKVIVGGQSAGGLLTAIAVLQDRQKYGQNRVQGQILDIPVLCHSLNFPKDLILPDKGSYEENRYAPILPISRLDLFETLLGEKAISDRSYNILLEEDDLLKASPPTHFHVAGRDILRDQSFLFMHRLQGLGVSTTFNVYPGVPHGFRRHGELEASKQWDKDHSAAIRSLLGQ